MRQLTAAVAALVLLAGAACGSDGDETEDGPAATGPPRIAVVPTSGARLGPSAPIHPVLTLDGALVAVGAEANSPAREHPLVTSTDGGRTWVRTEAPDQDQGDLSSWELVEADGLGLLVGGETTLGLSGSPPVLWVSDDGGASFQAAAGLRDGVGAGDVRSVVSVGDVLLAVGTVQRTGSFATIPATWTSTDRGRSWRRTDQPSLGQGDLFSGHAVASGDRALVTTPTGLVSSTDGGHSWQAVELPVPSAATIDSLTSDGELVAVTTRRWAGDVEVLEAAVSTDGGSTWIRSAPMPEVPDREGTGTLLSAPRSVRQVDGGALVAVASTIENNDRYLPYLVRSDDAGHTWTVAATPPACPSSAHIAPLAVVEGLAVATYDCGGPHRTDLLTSTDGGRTWARGDGDALGDRLLGDPFPSGPAEVTLLAGRGAVVHLSAPA